MPDDSQRHEIDHRTIKLTVGLIAVSIAFLTSAFAADKLTSISASYFEGGLTQTIFQGFLFAISALLFSYKGYSQTELVLSKLASIAAVCIAVFPCEYRGAGPLPPSFIRPEPVIHYTAATVMFLILAYFCFGFFRRALAKGHFEAKARASIYALCLAAILISISIMAIDAVTQGALTQRCSRLTFWCEAGALMAFGFSWLVASRVLPGITRADERFRPFARKNPL